VVHTAESTSIRYYHQNCPAQEPQEAAATGGAYGYVRSAYLRDVTAVITQLRTKLPATVINTTTKWGGNVTLILDTNKPRLVDEYSRLKVLNPAICRLLTTLSEHAQKNWHKDICITSILRTQEEEDKIYAYKPGHKHKTSAHMVYAAVDIRSRGLELHIKEMLAKLNSYNHTNLNKTLDHQTAIFHEVPGWGPHFHIQYQAAMTHGSTHPGHGQSQHGHR
jgi:hypothetical protein